MEFDGTDRVHEVYEALAPVADEDRVEPSLPADHGEYVTTGFFDGSGVSGWRKDLEEQGKLPPTVPLEDHLG